MNKNFFKKILKFIINFFNILFIVLSFILIFIAIFKKEWFKAFIEWMKIFVEWLWYYNYLIIFFSSAIESLPVIWVVFPWQNILLIISWFFWSISTTNLVYVIIIAILWAILGNYIWFLLWKYYWDVFFEKYWVFFGIWKTEVKYLKVWINKWGPLWIILWKFHPMTRAFLPFIAWSIWMKSKKFMIYNIIGAIIRATTIIILWVLFVNYYNFFVENAWMIWIVVLVAIWIYIYMFKRNEFKKYWDEKNKEIEEMAKKNNFKI